MNHSSKIIEEVDNLITDALESEKGVEKLKSFCISIHTQAKEEAIKEFRKNVSPQDYEWDGGKEYLNSLSNTNK